MKSFFFYAKETVQKCSTYSILMQHYSTKCSTTEKFNYLRFKSDTHKKIAVAQLHQKLVGSRQISRQDYISFSLTRLMRASQT